MLVLVYVVCVCLCTFSWKKLQNRKPKEEKKWPNAAVKSRENTQAKSEFGTKFDIRQRNLTYELQQNYQKEKEEEF